MESIVVLCETEVHEWFAGILCRIKTADVYTGTFDSKEKVD